MMLKAHVVVATPAYNSQTTIDYTQSMLNNVTHASQNGIIVTTVMIGNESLVTRARNTLASIFLHHAEAMKEQTGVKPTHLCFIDADIGFPPDTLLKLVESKVECVGAPVRLKGLTADGKPVYNIVPFPSAVEEAATLTTYDRKIKDLKPVKKLGTALLCLEYDTVEMLADNSPKYKGNSLRRGADIPMDFNYDIFQTKVVDEELLSEDYFVCHKLWELGVPVFCDYSIATTHTGMMQLHTNPQHDRFL